jgi:glycosyltransferase involved in cell wall biosynthesis
MKKVKVFHAITRLILGGAQQNTMETCGYLNPDRFESLIISGADTGPEGEIISEVRKRGIPLTIIPELVREPNPIKDFLALKKMLHLFRAEKPHIVHTHSSKAGILGRWAAKIAQVPVIVHTVHGWGHHEYQNFLKRNLFTFLERKTEKITDKLVVVSYYNIKKGLKDRIGKEEKYKAIHSSINLDEFTNTSCDTVVSKKELGINPETLVVGTVGRLSTQKNPCDFVKVSAAVKKEIPETQFLFIGDGPLRSETENLIKELNISKDIFLPGLRTDIPALLRCMDVFILTSLWEGLPRVIPQAMAVGLPVVANAIDGVCEVIKDGVNGFLIPPKNVSLMAKRVVQLLSSSSMRSEIGQKGRKTAEEEFSLRDMLSKIELLYEELLASKGVQV